MPAPPLHTSASQYGPYGVFVLDDGEGRQPTGHQNLDLVVPDERVGGRVARRRRPILRMLLLPIVAGTGAWVWIDRQTEVVAALERGTALVQDLVAQRAPPEASREAMRPSEPAAIAERDVATAALPKEAPREEPQGSDPNLPARDAGAEPPAKSPVAERLPEVTADPTDPLQKKALAAGLHPALSKALLERLSGDDFRNAAEAIGNALRQKVGATPVLWPQRRAKGQAQFRVKLVEGAPADCLRYVVQIAIDGWETTARPMERCRAVQAANPT